MRPQKSLMALIIVGGILLVTDTARAVTVKVDATMPPAAAVAPGGATFDLLAHSNCTAPAPAGPNAAATDFDSIRGGVIPAVAVGGGITIGPWWWPTVYAPLVGYRGKAKPAAANNQAITSSSGGCVGDATYKDFLGVRTVGARAWIPPLVAGTAAAEAVDPFYIDPGDYEYAPFIDQIEFETGDPGDIAGVTLWAWDSLDVDPLWELDINVAGLISGADDLDITFVSDPSLGLSDSLVESNIRSAFVISGSGATLTNWELFDTTYSVSETVQFETGLGSGVTGVPEPGTIVLSLSLLVLLRRRG